MNTDQLFCLPLKSDRVDRDAWDLAALPRQLPPWLRRIEVILTDIWNGPLRAQRHTRSTVSRQRQHNNPANREARRENLRVGARMGLPSI